MRNKYCLIKIGKGSYSIPECDYHSFAPLNLFLSADHIIYFAVVFSALGNYDHIFVSVSVEKRRCSF